MLRLPRPLLTRTSIQSLSSTGSITGIVPLLNNKILVYGSFTTINGTPCKNIACLNADGSVDTGFQVSGDISVDAIYAAARQTDGKILIGGYLMYYSASRVQSYLFRLNHDGSRDSAFDAGGTNLTPYAPYGINNVIRTICVDGNGKIIVGGDFSKPTNHVARLNADGSADNTFDPGEGPDGAVTHIAMQSTGHIIAGGSFALVNGTAKSGIARLNANGSLDSAAFGTGVSVGNLMALAVQPDNRVVIGGSFGYASGVSASIMARFSAEGELDTAFNPFIRGRLHEVTSLTASADYIFVGGWDPVMYFNGKPTDHKASIYVLQAGTGGYHCYFEFWGKPKGYSDVWALGIRTDGSLLAGGNFIQRDGIVDQGFYPGLCHLSTPFQSLDQTFKPIVGGQADVRAIALQADGKIIIGGIFYRINGNVQWGLGRLNHDGTFDATLTSPGTLAGSVSALLSPSNGSIPVAGAFSFVEDGYIVSRNELVLLSETGAEMFSQYLNTGNEMAWYPDNKVVVATQWSPGIKRFNNDLSEDANFQPGTGISNSQQPDFEFDRANAVAIQPDGKILLAGSFSSFSGLAADDIIRLNADGSRDNTFTSPGFTVSNFRHEIFSIAIQSDGKILPAGRFSSVGGVLCPTVTRLNPDGTRDETFNSPFANSGATAYSIRIQADGKILVGGAMQIVEGNKIYNSLIRMNPNGSRDTSFNASLTGTVRCIVTKDDMILAGGSFEAADGIARQGLVRYQPELHYVSKTPGCNGKTPCYISIQAALNAASDGAAIKVGQGEFDEAPVKNTTGTVIISGGWNDAFTDQTSGKTRLKAPAAPKGAMALREVVIIP